jgi:epoxyqueuosine reductase
MKVDRTVQKHLPEGRDYLIGYADLRNLLPVKYVQYGYGIVIARRLDDTIIDSIETRPNADYYELYQGVNRELAGIAEGIEAELCSNGIKAFSIAPTLTSADRGQVFDRTLSLDFSHKMVATRAGLGWIGKSDLLITYHFGPRVRLVSVLVDCPVEYCREPVLSSECQHCDLCVQSCPAEALSGEEWKIGTRREKIFDAFRCREKCRELGEQNVGKGARICGICVSVCPAGKRK